jgi:hypothetical protein
MKKAIVDVDGRVIAYVEEDLRHDFDILLLAVGSSRTTLQASDHWKGNDVREHERELIDFAQKTRERLDVAEMFILNFLRGGFSIQSVWSTKYLKETAFYASLFVQSTSHSPEQAMNLSSRRLVQHEKSRLCALALFLRAQLQPP